MLASPPTSLHPLTQAYLPSPAHSPPPHTPTPTHTAHLCCQRGRAVHQLTDVAAHAKEGARGGGGASQRVGDFHQENKGVVVVGLVGLAVDHFVQGCRQVGLRGR